MKVRSSSLALAMILLATAAITLLSVLMPDLDVELARLFFNPMTQRFPAASQSSLDWLRNEGPVIVYSLFGCIVGALLLKLLLPRRPLLISGRAIIFLTLTLAIGPGLLVNGVFKAHWGRPRPLEVVQFGGHESYVPWWSDRGGCPHNCSFMSGESSTAAWLFAPAVLVPQPWRAAALGATAVFTVIIGVLRMAYGGHFLTDVMFGALLTLLVIWLVHGLIFRWPATRLDERVIDKRLERAAQRLRRVLFAAARDRAGR